MNKILQYLKIHGEQLDTEIAKAAGISLAQVRLHLAKLPVRRKTFTLSFLRSRCSSWVSFRT